MTFIITMAVIDICLAFFIFKKKKERREKKCLFLFIEKKKRKEKNKIFLKKIQGIHFSLGVYYIFKKKKILRRICL